MKNQSTDDTAQPALRRDLDKTGDEPMTDAQRSYLETLCRERGKEFDDALTKAEASKRMDDLRGRLPIGARAYEEQRTRPATQHAA